MKRFFTPFAVLFSAILFFSFSNKQANNKLDLQEELILHFNELSPKSVTAVESLLGSISGINYINYCAKYDVFLLTYDNTIFSSEDYAIKAITNANPDLKPVAMKGNSIEMVSNNCQ